MSSAVQFFCAGNELYCGVFGTGFIRIPVRAHSSVLTYLTSVQMLHTITSDVW